MGINVYLIRILSVLDGDVDGRVSQGTDRDRFNIILEPTRLGTKFIDHTAQIWSEARRFLLIAL